jgi:hypothetical protein
MFRNRFLPIRRASRSQALSRTANQLLASDRVQMVVVIITGLGLLATWLWWLQVHSLL